MGKKVLIISSTLRANGNSEYLCKQFQTGAEEVGSEVKYITLKEKNINYCIGCYACRTLGKCFQNDDMESIIEEIIKADIIVFGTPIYFYNISGQLKTLIDRILPKYKEVKNKDIYLISSCAENEKEAIQGAINSIQSFIDCVTDVSLKGIIYGVDLHKPGDAQISSISKDAYEMGKKI